MHAIRMRKNLQSLEKKKQIIDKIKLIRRAKRRDISKVEKMCNAQTHHLFGDINVGDLICKSFISLVMENNESDIIASVCVNNFPNVPAIPPWSWTAWLRRLYRLNRITARNSLWIHLVTFNNEYRIVFLKEMLLYLYKKCFYVKYILFVIPPGLKDIEWLEMHGVYISPRGISDSNKVQNIFLTKGSDFMVAYKIRRAVVQDNDDVVELIDKYSPQLRNVYGEYYIAELLQEKEHEGRQVIVAEHKGVAVAVMILNDVVNYDLLNQNFKLETFYGLRKPHLKDVLKTQDPVDPAPPLNLSAHYDNLSLVSVPECVEQPDASSQVSLSMSSVSLCTSAEDDFELPLDIVEDLEMIMSEPVEEECNSEMFLGTLEDQAGCVVLSYTEEQYEKWAKKKKFEGSLSKNQVYHPKIPTYCGEGDAFVVEVASAQPDHEIALRYLLESSYECFPEYNYCILCVPSTDISFPLLKMFVRVAQRPSSNFAQELYVAHRSAVLSNLSVREATYFDIEIVDKLLGKLKSSVMSMQFNESVTMNDSEYKSYIFLCDKRIIGFAILSEQRDTEFLNFHYQLITWTDMARHKVGCHGAINFCILSPIFYKHSRYFLQELHRLSDFSILYYKVTPEDINVTQTRTLACVLDVLLPVIPAKLSECNTKGNEYWQLPNVLCQDVDPYALYISTPLHCGLSRLEINTKIVVVGASDVALAFLVELIFKNNPNYRLTFTNITLVAPHGICRQRTNKIRDILLPSRSVLHGQYLSLLSLRTYVNIVNGVMTAINRKDRTITVNSSFLPYDLLFITCGKQYQMPQRSRKLRGGKTEFPNNVFIVNTEVDADIALMKLHKIIIDSGVSKYIVIVYGHNLETLSCIAALLEFGIPSNNLVLVDEAQPEDEIYQHESVFNDPEVEEAIFNEVKTQGVEIHYGFKFVDWSFDVENNGIKSVVFESKYRLLELDCIGMFAYSDKMVSMRTYVAINRAGLVFDGGLVVDRNCQTNDPNIYAAGSVTKYPRRYYADHKKHQYFNQEEIGRTLAEHITARLLTKLNPPEKETLFSRCTDLNKRLVPQYKRPLVEYATLPGNLHYLSVRKPGIQTPHDVAMILDDYGQVFLTGDCKKLDDQGYFRLHLNSRNTVETITCLAKFPIQKVNLTCLWGKHERLLNNLIRRFEMVMVPDLFKYFQEDWTYVIYHDNYKKLSEDMNEIMTAFSDKEGTSLIENVYQMLENNNWHALSDKEYNELKLGFVGSGYSEAILNKLLSFIGDNMLFLPMYAHPLLVNIILGGSELSPFFKHL